MLNCNISLWPFGDEDSKSNLATINVANVGRSKSGAPGECDYVVTFREDKPLAGDPVSYSCVIRDYDRYASVFSLLAVALDKLRAQEAFAPVTEYELDVAVRLMNRK